MNGDLMESFIQNLEVSLYKGFIDRKYGRAGNYKPELLVNNTAKNENVLSTLLEELVSSKSFLFSVAFIFESGLAMLKSQFLDLRLKGISGRILTSTFLHFNQPKLFRELLKIKNVEVRLTSLEGFHSKGYIFDHEDYYSLIVGSSNLTAHALKVNYEWNVKLTSHENGEIIHHFKNQFEGVWHNAESLTEEWIQGYEKTYRQQFSNKVLEYAVEAPVPYHANAIEKALKITPNSMQRAALEGIQAVREAGHERGLVVSATGTGKTYLSAFDVRSFIPKRMLFIVHREQILHKTKSDFIKILGGVENEFGILSGTSKETGVKYLFATIQTISKDEVLHQFDQEAFDYILIDEVHKAGAKSYLKVIDYFKPQFLMGMTATPERTDDFNIYELFDYNIAYEIRLQEALEEKMLCPFHYFGVTDFEFNGEKIDDTTILSKLVTDERVNHIIEKVEYYGFSGDRVRGLMFCSRKEEAEQLSGLLNEKGYRTIALTGEHSQEERARRVSELENGELDYILTVDIFNEGIDIPSINQVVMLRQTQSSIVFIQQLGRGLRKHKSKDFVTIIDFIGNYRNNFLIPIALSGDRSQNKDSVRRRTTDTSYIKGVSTVNFEEIAKRQVFKAINNSNLNALKVLKEAFIELKNRIGKTPFLYDFVSNHSVDPVVIAEKYGSYYQFLIKVKEHVPPLSAYEDRVLTMFSLEILNGKRKHEMILLELLIIQREVGSSEYLEHLAKENCRMDANTIGSVERIFNLSFFTQAVQEKYGGKPIIVKDEKGNYRLNDSVFESLVRNQFFKKLMDDIVRRAREKSKQYGCSGPFTLYDKYSRKDACKLLNWQDDETSTIYGYKTKHDTCPIFITYHKNDEVDASVDYHDEFLNPEILKWFTRSNRTLKSEEVQTIIHAKENGIDIHIFVKKDNDEGSDFYYLGLATPDVDTVQEGRMKGKGGKELPVVHMEMLMEHPIESKLYHYIKNKMD
jgi:superfamily II DNA or RNA helicase/HKD family nuclease